jgi:hypothetical protein
MKTTHRFLALCAVLLEFMLPARSHAGAVPKTYTFNGQGNWSTASNWDANGIPPNPLPSGSTIIIAPGNTSTRTDIEWASLAFVQTIAAGATLTINGGGFQYQPPGYPPPGFQITKGLGVAGGGGFINHGQMNVNGMISGQLGPNLYSGTLSNDGTVAIGASSDSVTFNTVTNLAGGQITIADTLFGSTFDNQAGGTVTINNGTAASRALTNAGTLTNAGSVRIGEYVSGPSGGFLSGTFTNTGTYNQAAGAYLTGAGTVSNHGADYDFHGTLAPTDDLSLTAGYTPPGDATLSVAIEPDENDETVLVAPTVTVNGDAVLAGKLTLSGYLAEGTPAQDLVLLRTTGAGNTVVGAFATVNLDDLYLADAGLAASVVYTATEVILHLFDPADSGPLTVPHTADGVPSHSFFGSKGSFHIFESQSLTPNPPATQLASHHQLVFTITAPAGKRWRMNPTSGDGAFFVSTIADVNGDFPSAKATADVASVAFDLAEGTAPALATNGMNVLWFPQPTGDRYDIELFFQPATAFVFRSITVTINYDPTGMPAVDLGPGRYAEIGYSNDHAPSSDPGPRLTLEDDVAGAPEIAPEQPAGTDLTTGASIAFGPVAIGSSSAAKIFTIRNTGTSDLTLGTIAASGGDVADFSVDTTATTSPVAPGGSTTFSVTFTPGASVARSTLLRLASNDADENPFDLTLTGAGVTPLINNLLPQAVQNPTNFSLRIIVGDGGLFATDFRTGAGGGRVYGASIQLAPLSAPTQLSAAIWTDQGGHPGTLLETFDHPAAVPSTLSGIYTAWDDEGIVLAPNTNYWFVFGVQGPGSVTVFVQNPQSPRPPADGEIQFSRVPETSVESLVGSQSFQKNGGIDLYYGLLGTVGPGPEIRVEQPAGTAITDGSAIVNFGLVEPGSSSTPKTFTITNTGTTNLTLGTITTDGTNGSEFTVDTTGLSALLAPAESTTFSVTFTDGGGGSRSAALHIASDDGNESPFDIALTGTGAVPDIAVDLDGARSDGQADPVADFGKAQIGGSVLRTLIVTNPGTGTLTLYGVSVPAGFRVAGSAAPSGGSIGGGSGFPRFVIPGATAFIDVYFQPTANGVFSGDLQITSDAPAPADVFTFAVRGRAGADQTSFAATTGTGTVLDVLKGHPGYALTGLSGVSGGIGTIVSGKVRFRVNNAASGGSFTFTARNSLGATLSETVQVFAVPAGNYAGLLADTTGTQRGRVNLTVNAAGSCSGTVRTEGGVRTFAGSLLNTTSLVVYGFRLPRPLVLSPAVNFTPANPVLVATAGPPLLAIALEGTLERSPYDASHPAPQAGAYTMVADLPNGGTGPRTGAALTCTITTQGLATFAGKLGDGTAITQGGPLLSGGRLPFYVGTGSGTVLRRMVGEMTFDRSASPMVSGTLRWSIPANTNAYLRNGLEQDYSVLGTAYRPAVTGSQMLALGSSGLARLSLDMPSIATQPKLLTYPLGGPIKTGNVQWAAQGAIVGQLGRFYLGLNSGIYSGYYLAPRNAHRDFFGVVLQGSDYNYGQGFVIDLQNLREANLTPAP